MTDDTFTPAQGTAVSAEKMLDLLQCSTCFRGDVCHNMPCACAQSLADAARQPDDLATSSDGEPSNGKQPLMASRPAPPVPSDPRSSAATEGVRLSNWLADYSHDLKEEGDFDQEAAQLDRASQWIADHLNAVPQTVVVTDEVVKAAETRDEVVWLREVDAGTDNSCWVISNRVDPDSVPFFMGSAYSLTRPNHSGENQS